MRNEAERRKKIVQIGRRIFQSHLTAGSSGNLSVRLDDGFLITATNVSLGDLAEEHISKIDPAGDLVSGDRPSKELFLHRAMYEKRPQDEAIIHLHSTYSTAVSCLAGLDAASCIPPLTAYFVMKVSRLPLVPYFRPGDPALGDAVRKVAVQHHALLLANHGPIVSADSLENALYIAEELEETAKIFLLLYDKNVSLLTPAQISELVNTFGKR